MSLFIIQLAKMTLVVLGIFFTPIITRKFVSQLNLPVAQNMMKWGGLASAAVSGVALKAASIGKAGVQTTQSASKRELPSFSNYLTSGASSALKKFEKDGSSPSAKMASKVRSLLEKGNSKVQYGHLLNEAKKEGLRVPTKKELREAKFDPKVRDRVEKANEALQTFVKSKQGQKNPISGLLENTYTPPDQRLTSGVKAIVGMSKAGASHVQSLTSNFRSRSGNNSTSIHSSEGATPSQGVSAGISHSSSAYLEGNRISPVNAGPKPANPDFTAATQRRLSRPKQDEFSTSAPRKNFQEVFLNRTRSAQSKNISRVSDIMKRKEKNI